MWRKVDRFKILSGELLYIKKDKKEVKIKYFSNTFILSNNVYIRYITDAKKKSRNVIEIKLLVTWVQKEL